MATSEYEVSKEKNLTVIVSIFDEEGEINRSFEYHQARDVSFKNERDLPEYDPFACRKDLVFVKDDRPTKTALSFDSYPRIEDGVVVTDVDNLVAKRSLEDVLPQFSKTQIDSMVEDYITKELNQRMVELHAEREYLNNSQEIMRNLFRKED